MDFTEFDLHPDLLDGIAALNFKTATPIQEKAIPIILEGHDLIGTAQTGTGKTAAFVLPILEMILSSGEEGFTQALIIVPTRELAMQIDQVIEAYSYFTGVSSIAVYGGGAGADFAQEKSAITGGTDIIIATPGRLIAHINLGYVNFGKLKHLVLDEADRLLDMGFQEDLMKIIGKLPKDRQSLLFSATMPHSVMRFAKTLLKDPKSVSIALSKPAENVEQGVYFVHDRDKIALMADILKDRVGQRVIVFGSTKISVNNLYKQLNARKMPVAKISSDLEQAEREQVMLDFRSRKVDFLIATDVLSRGIDVEGIDLVVNFDVPRDAEDYVHRIGRTARAERKGTALTLVSPLDLKKLRSIERLIGKEIPKIPLPGFLQGKPEQAEKPNGEKSDNQRSGNSRNGQRRANGGRKPQEMAENREKMAENLAQPQVSGDSRSKKRRRRRKPKGAAPLPSA